MKALGSIAIVLAFAMACSSSEPSEEAAEEMEGVFVEAPEIPSYQAMHRGDPARTGVFDTEGVLETPEAKWVFQSERAIISSAVLIENKVIFGSDDGNLYALDAETGATVWTFEVARPVRTSPLVADGVVYFGSDDGFMNAINVEDGEVVWRKEIAVINSSPVLAHGTIFFGSDLGLLHAYDARTGLLTWETHLRPGRGVRSDPSVIGDTIFVASMTGRRPWKSTLHALKRSSGDEVWSFPMDGFTTFPVAVGGGAVFVTTDGTSGLGQNIQVVDGRLHAVDQSTGELRWTFQDGDVGFGGASAVTEELVLVGSAGVEGEGRLNALDIETGEVEWEFDAGNPIFTPPSVADGLVYFGTIDGKVWAVDIVTGQKRWEFQTDVGSEVCDPLCEGIETAPVLLDGVLYIGNNAGYFYALESPGR